MFSSISRANMNLWNDETFKLKSQSVYVLGSDSSTFLHIRVLHECCLDGSLGSWEKLEENQQNSELGEKTMGTRFLLCAWHYGCWEHYFSPKSPMTWVVCS